MFNRVQFIRDLCKERNIAIAKLEKDCGFSNGYLNPKKMSNISYDRAVVIADYLGVSTEYLLTGEESKNTPAEAGKRVDGGLNLSDREIYLIHLFRKLDERNQSATFSFINSLYETQPGEKANPAPKQA